MKCLYILILVLFWQGIDALSDKLKYPAPIGVELYTIQPGRLGLKLTWNPVRNWNAEDPIIGYKVVVWEDKQSKQVEDRFDTGDIKDEKIVDDSLPTKTTIELPKLFTVPVDKLEVDYGYIKPQVWYDYAALAFTKNGEGPLSPRMSTMSAGLGLDKE